MVEAFTLSLPFFPLSKTVWGKREKVLEANQERMLLFPHSGLFYNKYNVIPLFNIFIRYNAGTIRNLRRMEDRMRRHTL